METKYDTFLPKRGMYRWKSAARSKWNTAGWVRDLERACRQAVGGVLFIDEAYSLAGDTEDSYGKETIETILKAMEDHRVPFFIYMEE